LCECSSCLGVVGHGPPQRRGLFGPV
jgi:hypothetical protein